MLKMLQADLLPVKISKRVIMRIEALRGSGKYSGDVLMLGQNSKGIVTDFIQMTPDYGCEFVKGYTAGSLIAAKFALEEKGLRVTGYAHFVSIACLFPTGKVAGPKGTAIPVSEEIKMAHCNPECWYTYLGYHIPQEDVPIIMVNEYFPPTGMIALSTDPKLEGRRFPMPRKLKVVIV